VGLPGVCPVPPWSRRLNCTASLLVWLPKSSPLPPPSARPRALRAELPPSAHARHGCGLLARLGRPSQCREAWIAWKAGCHCAIALFIIQNEGNTAWSERLVAVGNSERSAYHAGWAFNARYAQHMSSMFQEVAAAGADQRLRLEEYDHQVSAKNHLIKDIQKGNDELLQENHRLEARVMELNDELIRTYRSYDMKLDFLDDAHTRLKNGQDELVTAQGCIHHLETELHERDEQLEASQAQATELQDAGEHLQELIPQEVEDPEVEPEEVEDSSGVEDS
jgi:hypothetical protein